MIHRYSFDYWNDRDNCVYRNYCVRSLNGFTENEQYALLHGHGVVTEYDENDEPVAGLFLSDSETDYINGFGADFEICELEPDIKTDLAPTYKRRCKQNRNEFVFLSNRIFTVFMKGGQLYVRFFIATTKKNRKENNYENQIGTKRVA